MTDMEENKFHNINRLMKICVSFGTWIVSLQCWHPVVLCEWISIENNGVS